MVELGELVTIKGGGTPSKSIDAYWDGDVPWASVKDFKSRYISQTQDCITQAGVENSATNIIPEGIIIIPTRMALGKVAITACDMAINQDLKALFINDECTLDRNYLARYLESKANYIESEGKGATVKGITLDFLKSIKVLLPPLAEQKRIATILDKADAIRQKRQQAIALADDFLRSVFLDMFGDPVTNPKGWEVHRMGDVIDFKGGSQPPKSSFIYEPADGYVRLVQIRDFKSYKYATYIPLEKAKRLFREDDVMIARYGPPVFQILRGMKGSYNVALMKASPKGAITKDFIFHLLQIPAYHDVVVANSERTAGQTGVNLELLNNFNLPLPSIEIQNKITTRIKAMENIMKSANQHLLNVNLLFESLSQKAFSGQL
ncbi:MAG: restriction endonuclease subunit S [Plesiomonas shigelloides]